MRTRNMMTPILAAALGLTIAFIYLSDELCRTEEIEEKVKVLLARIAERLE